MKIVIILTILLASFSASAFEGPKTHKGYAKWFEKIANPKLSNSYVLCEHEVMGYYACKLIKTGSTEGYEKEFKFLNHHLKEMNSNVESVYKIPMLILERSGNVGV